MRGLMLPLRRAATALGALGAVVLLTGSTLTWSEYGLPRTLNPLLAEARTGELIFDRLVLPSASPGTFHSHVLVETDGALKAELSEDGTALKLWVREGIRWHDGESFGADDVCFTIDTLLDPEQGSPFARPVRKALSSCEATENTVTLRYRHAMARPLAVLDVPVLPRHVLEGVANLREHSFSTHPIGTGPMRAVLGPRQVTLTAFPNPHHAPKIQQAVVRESGDPWVEVQHLRAGAVHGMLGGAEHLVWNENTWADLSAMKDEVGLRIVRTPAAPSIVYLALNTNRGPLASKRLREAVYRNLDASALATTTYEGRGDALLGPLQPPFGAGDALAVAPAALDPALQTPSVAAIMTEAGAHKGATSSVSGGGSVETGEWFWADGRQAWLEVAALYEGVADSVARPLTRQLRAADMPVRAGLIVGKREYLGPSRERQQGVDMVIAEWSLPPTGDLSALLHTPGPNGEGADNLLHYSNPAVDALLDKRDVARTEEELTSINKAILERITEDRSHILLWQTASFGVWRSEVHPVHTTPGHVFTEFDQWTMEEAE